MEYKFFEMITSSELDLNQIVKRGIMFKAASAKIANPKETKKNIAKSLNVSERTLQRYANDLNFTSFKKNKATTHFEPSKCLYCSFIAKNKSGLGAHTRSKHLEELANQPTMSNNTKKKETSLREPLRSREPERDLSKKTRESKKNKETLGMGDEIVLKSKDDINEEIDEFLKTKNNH